MGAEYSFYMKSIETHARAFLALIILPIGTVYILRVQKHLKKSSICRFDLNVKFKFEWVIFKKILWYVILENLVFTTWIALLPICYTI